MGLGSSPVARASTRVRALGQRHGRRTVVLLGIILALGLAVRMIGVAAPIDSSYQGADAARYELIAASLFTDHRFALPGADNPYDWSPGGPLLYAGVYYLIGGVHPWVARLAIALLGLVTILLCYVIGRRLRGPAAGVLAAGLAAAYPAFVFNTGRLLAEPPAEVTVPAAALGFLWASERRAWWAWAVPGVMIGLSALARPEYLLFGVMFVVLALARAWYLRGLRHGLAAAATLAVAFLAPVAPWAAHVSAEEGRFVPISTGSGKALFIGTYISGDGIHRRVKVKLMERYFGKHDITDYQRDHQPMEPLLDRAAAEYPSLDRDTALGRIGRRKLVQYAKEQPLSLGIMWAKKIGYMWQGSSGAMQNVGGYVLQGVLVAFALAAMVMLAVRRRFEVLVLGGLILGLTLFSGVVLAAPRRNLAVMPLVICLASMGLVNAALLVRSVAGERFERRRRTRGPLRATAMTGHQR